MQFSEQNKLKIITWLPKYEKLNNFWKLQSIKITVSLNYSLKNTIIQDYRQRGVKMNLC